MKVEVSGIKEIISSLTDLGKKQVPFAISKALNDTAFQAKSAMDAQIKQKLDRPMPFTQRATKYKKSNKRNLEAIIFIQDNQAEYLKYVFSSGIRKPKKKAIPTPTKKIRLNKYGNLPRKKISKLLSDKSKYFSGKPKGFSNMPEGIYQKTGRGKRKAIKLLIQWEPEKKHVQKLNFDKTVIGVVKNNFEKNFQKAITYAIQTAK